MPGALQITEGSSDPLWRTFTLHAVAPGGTAPVASATAWVRPDRRCFVSVTGDAQLACRQLLDAIVPRAGTVTLHVTAPASDATLLALYERLGFAVVRRERSYAIDVAGASRALTGTPPLDGAVVVCPDDADLDRLRMLDDTLRNDVPGTDGWKWTAEQFRDETFGPQYDAELYTVAVDGATGDYIGIARVWNNPSVPRLGMVGVVRAHRRRGVARALLARVVSVLAERGTPLVTTEVDVTNEASTSLVLSLGAEATGDIVELVRLPA